MALLIDKKPRKTIAKNSYRKFNNVQLCSGLNRSLLCKTSMTVSRSIPLNPLYLMGQK